MSCTWCELPAQVSLPDVGQLFQLPLINPASAFSSLSTSSFIPTRSSSNEYTGLNYTARKSSGLTLRYEGRRYHAATQHNHHTA